METLDGAAIAALRSALESERETLRREIAAEGGAPDSGDLGMDLERGFADSAHVTAERARVVAMLERLRRNLREVGAALERIDRGTYGRCERCGRAIGRERLEALPSARLCITCKQAVG
jgi:RNA polymerase-binding protein DksA